MGFSRQEHWSGLSFPPPGDLPDPGIKPMSLMSPALAGRFFITSATWEALGKLRSASKGILLLMRSFRQTTLLIKYTGHSSCLFLSCRFQFPTGPMNYSNKPVISSFRNLGTLILLTWQSLPPTALLVYFVPEHKHCVTLHGV